MMNLFKELQELAEFKVIIQGDNGYPEARIIANSRFTAQPGGIAYCKNEDNIQFCLHFCREKRLKFRIRSGGHQHEGMCSANNVLIIDLTHMNNTILYQNDYAQAWIPSGKRLDKVYAELAKKSRTIPGGGCQSVNIGGLTHGGGWGTSCRKLGLTCDNIVEARIVCPDGTIKTISENNDRRLFWAIRGGGGGNFGVVTKFLFNLTKLTTEVHTFSLKWGNKDMFKIAMEWAKMQANLDHDHNLSTFCRLLVKKEYIEGEDSPVLLGGKYYGPRHKLDLLLEPFYQIAEPFEPKFEIAYRPVGARARGVSGRSKPPINFLASHESMLGSLLQLAAPNAPKSTCDDPHPHKVSSSFPSSSDHKHLEGLMDKMVKYIKNSSYSPAINKYMSLHCMGGQISKVSPTATAFPHRQSPFMMQIQAWWSVPNDPKTPEYLDWVKDFRLTLKPYTEGAFINFPDKTLVPDYTTPQGRIDLLTYYYKGNLCELMDIKNKYDANNLFNFGMSIPPKPCKKENGKCICE